MARRRHLSKLKPFQNNPQLAPNGANYKKGKATDIVAETAGLSSTTFELAVKIIEKASEELKKKLRASRGSRTDQFKQVGNAVPPLLAKAVAECVGRMLEAVE